MEPTEIKEIAENLKRALIAAEFDLDLYYDDSTPETQCIFIDCKCELVKAMNLTDELLKIIRKGAT